ncbi:SLBB domain-containing protein [Halioxenophilus sp. WMMB6]|uniref:SLBB domain-containing protein n=1 Tax=Halioxenophilus sp. WMMB6 TaxID=3073815 RepID=UPI00295E5DFB|nr:SLBB domain-containing protein [Halioxenophilus sp. WMMB6]
MDPVYPTIKMKIANIARFKVVTLLLSLCCMNGAFAQTAAQIEQFKSLSPAQQEAVARQMGIDISAFGGQSTNSQPNIAEPVTPRSALPLTELPEGALLTDEETALLEPEEDEPPLKAFGYDLFEQPLDSFQPAVDVPIPADYVMGPGDSLVVQLYGKENASYSLVINREGQVQFPEIGPINLAGLKFSRAQEVINQTISEQMIGVKSSVTMGALRSIRVFVLGEVLRPGSYTVSSLSTMTNALFASGGIDTIGSLRTIQLKRAGKLITTLDLYDLLLKGDTSDDARLLPGDVIFIPPVGVTASIDGEVKRPGIYELKHEKTMAQLVALAGGYLATAYPSAGRVERIDSLGNRTVVDVDLTSSAGKQASVSNGDALMVASILDTKENIVTLEGYVKRPGDFNWRQGLRVSDLVPSVYALQNNPDLSIGVITREVQPTRKLEVLYFNLGNAIQAPGSIDDVALQPRDKVTLFGYEEDRGETLLETVDTLQLQANKLNKSKVVTIRGYVRHPAKYPLQTGGNLESVIALAGGLTEYAYGLQAEITRYHIGDDVRQIVEHIPVNLAGGEMPALEPGDAITIKRIPNWVKPETVVIEGEVLFPGEYTLSRGETLSQVLARAGGLTGFAYAKGAVFTRESLKALEAKQLADLQANLQADIAAAELEQQSAKVASQTVDAESLLDNLKAVKPQGRMVIDLAAIVAGKQSIDVELVDGDKLFIPRHKQSITVVGEVQFPTSHLYEKKLDIRDYIDRSGGFNLRADKRRVYVVKANGRVFLPERKGWFHRGGVKIEAGDTVVVPLNADRIESLTLWTSISQIFYQIALGAAAVNSF